LQGWSRGAILGFAHLLQLVEACDSQDSPSGPHCLSMADGGNLLLLARGLRASRDNHGGDTSRRLRVFLAGCRFGGSPAIAASPRTATARTAACRSPGCSSWNQSSSWSWSSGKGQKELQARRGTLLGLHRGWGMARQRARTRGGVLRQETRQVGF